MIANLVSKMLDRSGSMKLNQQAITASSRVLQGEREERPPLLPLSGASASGSGHNVPQRAHNTAELATGSVSVLLFRMLLPVAHGHRAECCLPAAAARARRRNRRHRGRLVADQWRDSTIPAGKRGISPPGLVEIGNRSNEKKKKKKKKRFSQKTVVALHHFARAPCVPHTSIGRSHCVYRISVHFGLHTPFTLPFVYTFIICFLTKGARGKSGCLIFSLSRDCFKAGVVIIIISGGWFGFEKGVLWMGWRGRDNESLRQIYGGLLCGGGGSLVLSVDRLR